MIWKAEVERLRPVRAILQRAQQNGRNDSKTDAVVGAAEAAATKRRFRSDAVPGVQRACLGSSACNYMAHDTIALCAQLLSAAAEECAGCLISLHCSGKVMRAGAVKMVLAGNSTRNAANASASEAAAPDCSLKVLQSCADVRLGGHSRRQAHGTFCSLQATRSTCVTCESRLTQADLAAGSLDRHSVMHMPENRRFDADPDWLSRRVLAGAGTPLKSAAGPPEQCGSQRARLPAVSCSISYNLPVENALAYSFNQKHHAEAISQVKCVRLRKRVHAVHLSSSPRRLGSVPGHTISTDNPAVMCPCITT